MNLSQPNKLSRPKIIRSKLLITLFELYCSDFCHFCIVLVQSVGQLACFPIFVSADTPSPSVLVPLAAVVVPGFGNYYFFAVNKLFHY